MIILTFIFYKEKLQQSSKDLPITSKQSAVSLMLVSNDKVLWFFIKWRKGHILFFILYNVLYSIHSVWYRKLWSIILSTNRDLTWHLYSRNQGPRLVASRTSTRPVPWCRQVLNILIMIFSKGKYKIKTWALGIHCSRIKEIYQSLYSHQNYHLLAQLYVDGTVGKQWNLGSWFPK